MERFSRIKIDRKSAQPAFRQLVDGILQMINSGEIAIGEQLPTVDELSQITQLSRMTVQRAMQTLQRKHCVSSRRGRGAFVVAKESHTEERLSIGFIVRPHRDPNADPFYSEILQGVAKSARQYNIDLAFAQSETEIEDELSKNGFPLLNRVSSIMLAGQMPDSIYNFLHRAQVPYVLIDAIPTFHSCDAVIMDNEKTGSLMGKYLVSLGHRNILYLNGLPEIRAYTDRLRGFVNAFPKGELVLHELHGAQMAQDGQALIDDALERKMSFSAIVGCNDMVAIGAMNELQDRGYHVPNDVSVVGFNNIPFAAHVRPSLTTIQIPKREMGSRAVHLLLQRMQNPKAVHETVVLDVSLVERQSSAPIPTHGGINVSPNSKSKK